MRLIEEWARRVGQGGETGQGTRAAQAGAR